MKKFIIIIILIFLGFGGYVAYVELTKDKTPPLTPEATRAEITKYIVYGTHLNIEGSLTVDSTIQQRLKIRKKRITRKKIYNYKNNS